MLNLINSYVFLVKDKDKFINLVSNTLHDKSEGRVNQGSQSIRGQISLSMNFLSFLDKHFRDSLYNHNKYHSKTSINRYIRKVGDKSEKDLNKVIFPLSRDKFSFNNIHMNLGGIR